MAYTDRLRDMIYTAPSGRSFALLYDAVSESSGKKAPVSEFPLQNQGAVQDLGQTTKTYSVSAYISGPDYDIDADEFASALDQTGPGTLEHPRYGVLTVLPRSVNRSESFVEGAGRASFEIEFVKADPDAQEYQRIRSSIDDLIAIDIDAAEAAAVAALADKSIEGVRELVAVTAEVQTTVNDLRTTFADTLAENAEAAASFNDKTSSLLRDLSDIIDQPAVLFERIMEIVAIPIDVVQSGLRKAKSVKQAVERIATRLGSLGRQYGDIVGLFSAATLQGFLAWVSGLTVNGLFLTRGDAGRAIDTMQDTRVLLNDAIGTAEEGGQPADYEVQLLAENAFARGVGNLIDRSLSLPTERVITLDREVPPTVLAWELYGDLDQLDEFIDYNEFGGDELLVIPRGTQVRYYV